jgi:hypothetical protein
MYQSKKTLRTAFSLGGAGLHFTDPIHELVQFLKRLLIQGVIDPPSLGAISDQAGFLEDPQMKRQAGLTGLEGLRQVADALFPILKTGDNPEPRLIGKRVKNADEPSNIFADRLRHDKRIYINKY